MDQALAEPSRPGRATWPGCVRAKADVSKAKAPTFPRLGFEFGFVGQTYSTSTPTRGGKNHRSV